MLNALIYLGLQGLPIPAMTEYQEENLLLTLNDQKNPKKIYKTIF